MARDRSLYLPGPIPPDEAYPDGGTVYRPILLTRVYTTEPGPVKVPCVLDTGADCCLLPASIAISLGLDIHAMPRGSITGIGNEVSESFYSYVTFELGRGLRFRTRVGFSVGLNAAGVGVLGQLGFFDQFNVEFRLAEGVFTIEPAAKPAIQ